MFFISVISQCSGKSSTFKESSYGSQSLTDEKLGENNDSLPEKIIEVFAYILMIFYSSAFLFSEKRKQKYRVFREWIKGSTYTTNTPKTCHFRVLKTYTPDRLIQRKIRYIFQLILLRTDELNTFPSDCGFAEKGTSF